jgi:GNAT superfamily N-acetyltransferase
MPVELRAARESDAPFLTEVVIETTRDQGRLARDFDENAFRMFYEKWSLTELDNTSVIVVDGVSAGRLRVLRTPDSLELAGIQLLPPYQGIGIGRLLLDGLKQEASATRTPIELSVERDNPRAKAFYEREGFTLVTTTTTDDVLRWTRRSS